MTAESRARHVFVVPDGNRRYARRERLAELLRESRESLEGELADLDRKAAEGLQQRLTRFVESGRDPQEEGTGADLLDHITHPLSLDELLAAYRRGARRMDALLRSVLDRSSISILSMYGMQARNLLRSDDEILGFLTAEAECAARWAEDDSLMRRCRFEFIGDRRLLEQSRQQPGITEVVDAYLQASAELERRSSGSELKINILAPYDFSWEINQAIQDGKFDAERLRVTDRVDLVIRTGCASRSLASGALPCQLAFSQLFLTRVYFPDFTTADFERAIDTCDFRRSSQGL